MWRIVVNAALAIRRDALPLGEADEALAADAELGYRAGEKVQAFCAREELTGINRN